MTNKELQKAGRGELLVKKVRNNAMRKLSRFKKIRSSYIRLAGE